MFRVKPRANLGLIFFSVLIQKSEKQWKVRSGCLKNLPSGIPLGHQTFPWGCAPQESLMTLRNSLRLIFPDNHCGLSTVYTTFQAILYDIGNFTVISSDIRVILDNIQQYQGNFEQCKVRYVLSKVQFKAKRVSKFLSLIWSGRVGYVPLQYRSK